MLPFDLGIHYMSGLFHSEFPIKVLYTFLVPHMRATYPAHLILLNLITRIRSHSYKLLYVVCIQSMSAQPSALSPYDSSPVLQNRFRFFDHFLFRVTFKGGGDGLQICRVKLSLCLTKHHAMKTYWGSGSVTPRILNLSTRWT
jgi:hypothetical protein